MKIDKKIILASTGLLFVGTAMAQVQQKDSTLTRTVVVENQYNPEVMDAFKVNVLPKVEEPAVAKKHIDYATGQSPLIRFGFEPMGVMTRNVQQAGARRGYVRGSYGMVNHTDVKASYLWDLSKSNQLGVMGSFYGHSGDVPAAMLNDETDESQRFFRGDFGLDYSHAFDKVKLNLGVNFANQVFGYQYDYAEYGLPGDESIPDGSGVPRVSNNQHFMMGNGYVGLSSVKGQTPVDFDVTLGFDAFKRKKSSFGVSDYMEMLPDYLQKMIFAKGAISGELSEESRVGIGFGVSHVMYNDDDYSFPAENPKSVEPFENQTLIQLNPYYAIQTENLNVRLGAHVDIQTKVGSGLKVAPDLRAAYSFSDSYVLYLQALGGTTLNDFNRLNEVSPYWNSQRQIKTTYTVFDAQAGFKASPVNGLGLKLYGGYRLTKDDVFVLPSSIFQGVYVDVADLQQDKSKVFYAGAGLSYDYRDALSFSLKGQYNNWKMGNKDNISYLLLKPEYTINADVNFMIYHGLRGLVTYQYEARKKVAGERQNAVNFLRLGAEKQLMDRLTVFVHANNVLDQNYYTETGYPDLGINVVGGISLRF